VPVDYRVAVGAGVVEPGAELRVSVYLRGGGACGGPGGEAAAEAEVVETSATLASEVVEG
jgi:hypothetical protein